MKIKKISYKLIKPYWRNPRVNEQTIEHLKESIKKFGFRVPLVLDKENVIVTGHARFKAIMQLEGQLDITIDILEKTNNPELAKNLKEINKGIVPVLYADGLDEKRIKQFRISDNRLSEFSQWNWEQLKLELKEVENAIGFTTDEINRILKDKSSTFDFYKDSEIADTKEMLENKFKEITDNAISDYLEIYCPKCEEPITLNKKDFN